MTVVMTRSRQILAAVGVMVVGPVLMVGGGATGSGIASGPISGAGWSAGRWRLTARWQITSEGIAATTTSAGASHHSADTPPSSPGTGSVSLPTSKPNRKRKVLPPRAVRAMIRAKGLGFCGLGF